MPNLKDKFDEFIKNNDVNGALDYAYQLYSDMRKSYAEGGNPFSEENTERSRAVEAFIAEITACDGKKEILPEKREFLDRFLLAIANALVRFHFDLFGSLEREVQTHSHKKNLCFHILLNCS